MNGRLYRLTPAGGKPNHYTDSYASALTVLGPNWAKELAELAVGEDIWWMNGWDAVERIA